MVRPCTRWIALAMSLLVPAPGWAQAPRPTVPVYIEDSPAAQELADDAELLIAQDRLAEAVETLQQIIQTHPRKLMRTDTDLYTDGVLWVRARLLGDPALLEVYRKLYEANADRELRLARREQVTAQALEALMLRYALTRSGMEAALDLAALHLERADASGAASALDEVRRHPDLNERRERYHALAALVGLLAGDTERLDHHRDRLRDLGFVEAAASVDTMSNLLHPPYRLGREADVKLSVDALPREDNAPLWAKPLDTEQAGATPHEQMIRRRLPPRVQAGAQTHLPILPSADHRAILINDGRSILALDRSSGRELWRHDWSANRVEAKDARRIIPAGRIIPDQRGVLVDGERVYGVMGRASSWPSRSPFIGVSTVMLCLDRSTGEPIWETRPADLDPNLSRGYFFGTPLRGRDHIFTLVRRNQVSHFQDTFLVALDAATGRAMWHRHVSSTVGSNQYTPGPPPQMIADNGTLYVCDPLGVVAAIDTRTSAFLWLRVMRDDAARIDLPAALTGGLPTRVSAPTLVEAGLLVPTAIASSPLLLLDPSTGQTRRDLNDTPLAEMTELQAAGPDVLGVTKNNAILFDGATLEPKWRTHLTMTNPPAPGAVSVAGDIAIVGSEQNVIALNLRDGSIVLELPTNEPAGVLMLDGQIVLASVTNVFSYLDWQRAYDSLMGQMLQRPDAPEAGLALAHLALHHRKDDAVLKGVDHALSAANLIALKADAEPDHPVQRRMFDQLVGFADSTYSVSPALRSELFDRIATSAASPDQEVVYHLSYGAFLDQRGRVDRAVDHYQAVLLDPTLASRLYARHNVFRQAGLEARGRLAELIDKHGPTVYATYDRLANQRFEEVLAQGSVDAEQMIGLAAGYPLAEIAPRALYEAAVALIAAGDTRGATRHLRRAYQRASDADLLARIAGLLAQSYRRNNQPQRAMQWLRRVSREHPGLVPMRDGQPMPIDLWLVELSHLELPYHALPGLTLPLGRSWTVPGRLMTPSSQGHVAPPRDRFVTRLGQDLLMYLADSSQPAWRVEVPGDDLELLLLSDRQVLLWSAKRYELTALDAETGERAWPAVRVDLLLHQATDDDEAQLNRPPEQRQFVRDIDPGHLLLRAGAMVADMADPRRRRGHLVAAGTHSICIGDRLGRVAALDRSTGELIWRQKCSLDTVSQIAIGDDAVALAGTTLPGTDAQSGGIVLLDLVTGEPRLPDIEDRQPPRWVGFGGDGLLLSVSPHRVNAYDVFDGGVPWRIDITGHTLTGHAWAGPDLALLLAAPGAQLDGIGVVLVLDCASGRVANRISVLSFDRKRPVHVASADLQWQLATGAAALALDEDGGILWRDAITPAGAKRLVGQLVGARHVVIAARTFVPHQLGHAPQQPQLDQPAEARARRLGHRLYVLDRHTGALVAEHPIDPAIGSFDPDRALLLDDRLVFAAGDQTLVIPGAQAAP